MKKIEKWIPLLNAFIEQRKSMPFKWGVNDCSMFISDAVLTMTGVDPAKKFRDKYSTEIGAIRAMKRYGAGKLKDTLLQEFGAPIARLNAGRGDVVYFNTEEGETAGIVFGGGIIATGPAGIVVKPITAGEIFWSIEKWQ